VRLATLFVVLAIAGGCRHPAPPAPVVEARPAPSLPPEPPWLATFAALQIAVDSARFAVADSILAEFDRTEATARDSSESAFWRAVLKSDPRNPDFTPAGARAALEAYAASDYSPHQTEVAVMLRLLTLSDSLRSVQATQKIATDARDKARDEELQRLRDDLARTQAELDRIKRRLGPPKP
jgi:hypothetical protein